MENNLVYRVSGNGISFSGPRAGHGQSSTVKNNILAFARQSMLNAYDSYSFGTDPPQPMFFTASNNGGWLPIDHMSGAGFYWPVFQVTIIGRFWVTDEAVFAVQAAKRLYFPHHDTGGRSNK